MHRLSILSLTLLLAGCDSVLERAFNFMAGRRTSVVMLAKQPTLLAPDGATFSSQEPMKVLGEWTAVCLSLKGGVPAQDSKATDLAFAQLMQDAKVKVFLNLDNGRRVPLGPPHQAWSKRGKVLPDDELAACASTPCRAELPTESTIRSIEISSEPSLKVEGIFWESETDLNPKAATSSQAAAASAPAARFACNTRGA
jgi:hypothetical protein